MNAPHNPYVIQCVDHDSELGRWSFWRRPPAPLLAPYVTELQGYVERCGTPVVRDEYPTGQVHMIIVLEHAFELLDAPESLDVRTLQTTFIAGMHRVSASVGSTGKALCMQVDFTPLGARRFLGIDSVELADRVVDLDVLQPAFARELKGRLLESLSWEARFAWLEGCLARRIFAAPDDDERIEWAWRAISDSGGNVLVGDLSQHLGLSRKHFNDVFTRHIGVSPKTYARIIRFSRACEMIQARVGGPALPLTQIAAACGYADQAHFNREFRAMAGTTPTSMLRRLSPDGTGIMSEE